jgi:hypothetical protein
VNWTTVGFSPEGNLRQQVNPQVVFNAQSEADARPIGTGRQFDFDKGQLYYTARSRLEALVIPEQTFDCASRVPHFKVITKILITIDQASKPRIEWGGGKRVKATLLILVAVLVPTAAQEQRRAYDHPRVTGYAVDNCLYFGEACGKPAADAFCDRRGYRESESYRVAPARPTMVLGEDRVCDAGFCAGLVDVVCVGTSNSDDLKRLDSEFPLEFNTNREGADYHNFALREPRPELCRRACAHDSSCRAFTYTRPGTTGRGDTPWCYLKNGVPDATRRECCVSGVKKY